MRRLPIILPLAIILTCSLLYIAVIPGRIWYSQIVQRPRIARYAAALGVGEEQHLVTGTKTLWDSKVVDELAFYVLPRTTNWSSYDASLSAFGLPKSTFAYSNLPDGLPWASGTNGLLSSITPRSTRPIQRDPALLYFSAQQFSTSGIIGIRIYDTRNLGNRYVINGKDLDDYYVLMISVGECQYGSVC